MYLDDLAPWEGPSEANPTGPSDTLQRLKGKDRVRVQRSLLLSRDNTLNYLDLLALTSSEEKHYKQAEAAFRVKLYTRPRWTRRSQVSQTGKNQSDNSHDTSTVPTVATVHATGRFSGTSHRRFAGAVAA